MRDSKTNRCGCCEVSVPPTPEMIKNRPALSSIEYRVGTYATFRQAMIEAIASAPELRKWTARTSDDYGIAFLEMWAYLADILTFYQERIANESFLRTAIFPESVRCLAALLDYKPAPGLAAIADLAFTVEKGKEVKIPVGLKVQSVPGQGEKPQKFETLEEIFAESRLNSIKVYSKPNSDNPLVEGRDTITVTGDISHISPGDRLVIYKKIMHDPGEVSIALPSAHAGAEARHANGAPVGSYVVYKAGPGNHPEVPSPVIEIHVEDKKVKGLREVDWRQQLVFEPSIRKSFGSGDKVHKWVRKFQLFGYNAPSEYIASKFDSNGNITYNVFKATYNHMGSVEGVSESKATVDLDALYDDIKENVQLLIVYSKGLTYIVMPIKILGVVKTEAAVKGNFSDGGTAMPWMQSTVTRLLVETSAKLPDMDSRRAVIYELEGDELELWKKMYHESFDKSAVYIPISELELAFDQDVEHFIEPDRRLMLEDWKGTSIAVTAIDCGTADNHLKVSFKPDQTASFSLYGNTAILYGNVARASHGETVANEVLGDGDASKIFQQFSLKKPPVTYLPSLGKEPGSKSTLEIRVGGVLWREVRSLYGHGHDERIYTTMVDEKGVTRVQFGDGKTGARLPTGRKNVVATYRQGLGREGIVPENRLTKLMDRPLGLKGVTNPLGAEGGADSETLDKTRINAPNTVRTFDRIVSLRDFEDAAREDPRIAKSLATWVWDGEERVVFLTVAGDGGAEISDEVIGSITSDLDSQRDINRKMWVESFRPVPIDVEALIYVNDLYQDADVLAFAKIALEEFFAFENLSLGQSVHLSDVMSVLQRAEGVFAVDVNGLQYHDLLDRSIHGVADDPVLMHLPIYSAHVVSTNPVEVRPAELAKLESLKLNAGRLRS